MHFCCCPGAFVDCVVVLIKKYARHTVKKNCTLHNALAHGKTVVIPIVTLIPSILLTMKNIEKLNGAQCLDTNMVLSSVSVYIFIFDNNGPKKQYMGIKK